MIFQDSQSSLNPTKTIGEQVAEPVRLHRGASKARGARPGARGARAGRAAAPARAARRLPAPALGRAAPARDDRDRALLRAEGADRRRADDRARRHDPGADPARCSTTSSERLGMATLLVTHDMGVVAGRTDRDQRHVRRADRRDGADRAAVRGACATPTRRRCSARSRGSTRTRPSRSCRIPGLPPDLTQPAARAAASRRAARARPTQCRRAGAAADGRGPEPPVRLLAPGRRPDRASRRRSRRRRARCGRDAARRRQPSARRSTNVVREYPVTAGAVLQRKVGSVKAVSDVTLHRRRRRDARAGRRVGCGKTTLGKLDRRDREARRAARSRSTGEEVFALRGRRAARARAATCR